MSSQPTEPDNAAKRIKQRPMRGRDSPFRDCDTFTPHTVNRAEPRMVPLILFCEGPANDHAPVIHRPLPAERATWSRTRIKSSPKCQLRHKNRKVQPEQTSAHHHRSTGGQVSILDIIITPLLVDAGYKYGSGQIFQSTRERFRA